MEFHSGYENRSVKTKIKFHRGPIRVVIIPRSAYIISTWSRPDR